jgi:hypothetical protein
MSDDANVLAWLMKYSLPKGSSADSATHYSLMGGKYEIPDDQHEEWLERYAAHLVLRPHVPLFFVEKRTPFFRMHFDLDLVQPEVPALVDVIAMVNVCNSVFRTFYPGSSNTKQFVCIVLKSPPMPKGDGIKTGFHVVWPYLLVDQTQALTLRESCIIEAMKALGERLPPYNSFEDVLDMCVFVENGLRMVFSDKTRQCDLCKGKGRLHGNPCEQCRESKRVSENRVYRPYFVLDERGELDTARLEAITVEEDRARCVHACSIRCVHATAPTPGYVRPPLAPACDVVTVMKKHQKRQRLEKAGVRPGTVQAEARERGCKWLDGATEVDVKSAVVQQLEQFLQKSMGRPEWHELMVQKLFYSASQCRYLAKVYGQGAQYCTNVQRCHGSSTIYFVIDAVGVAQRCYSLKKHDGCVPCNKYASTPVMLNKVLHAALFEEEGEGGASVGTAPEVLVEPVQPDVPLLLTADGSEQGQGKMAAYLSLLPPDVIRQQQLVAQQSLQRLMLAMERKKSSGAAQTSDRKKAKTPFHKAKAVKAASVLTAPPTARASDLIMLDNQRASEQKRMIQQLRKDVSGSAPRSNKRVKNS